MGCGSSAQQEPKEKYKEDPVETKSKEGHTKKHPSQDKAAATPNSQQQSQQPSPPPPQQQQQQQQQQQPPPHQQAAQPPPPGETKAAEPPPPESTPATRREQEAPPVPSPAIKSDDKGANGHDTADATREENTGATVHGTENVEDTATTSEAPAEDTRSERSIGGIEEDDEQVWKNIQKLREQAILDARRYGVSSVTVCGMRITSIGGPVEMSSRDVQRVRKWADMATPFEPIPALEATSETGRPPREPMLRMNQELLDAYDREREKGRRSHKELRERSKDKERGGSAHRLKAAESSPRRSGGDHGHLNGNANNNNLAPMKSPEGKSLHTPHSDSLFGRASGVDSGLGDSVKVKVSRNTPPNRNNVPPSLPSAPGKTSPAEAPCDPPSQPPNEAGVEPNPATEGTKQPIPRSNHSEKSNSNRHSVDKAEGGIENEAAENQRGPHDDGKEEAGAAPIPPPPVGDEEDNKDIPPPPDPETAKQEEAPQDDGGGGGGGDGGGGGGDGGGGDGGGGGGGD